MTGRRDGLCVRDLNGIHYLFGRSTELMWSLEFACLYVCQLGHSENLWTDFHDILGRNRIYYWELSVDFWVDRITWVQDLILVHGCLLHTVQLTFTRWSLCETLNPMCILFMVALCNRAGHYIFVLWFLLLSSSSFFFFLA